MGKSRTAEPVSAAELEQAALHHLGRYVTSTENLRRILRRRLRKASRAGRASVADDNALVETVIGRLMAAGLLDDARYAQAHATSLARRGASLVKIRADLAGRGVAAPHADAAIAELKREAGGADAADREAALAYARRRRLGPFRAEAHRAAFRLRDLQALGRAGYSLDVARAVVDAKPENA